MSNEGFLSVGEAAAAIHVPPRAISNALYDRKLDVARCPLVAGRRLIPRDYLPDIEAVLRSHDKEAVAEPATMAG